MDREASIELIHYLPISSWKPKLGDIIIKHGWIQRTQWFGVINFMFPDGSIEVVRDGMMKLLAETGTDQMKNKSFVISPASIKSAFSGTYSIMQYNGNTNAPVWYV